MKFNYNLEIDNILNKIYKRKIFDLACENNISSIDSKNIESYKNQFKLMPIVPPSGVNLMALLIRLTQAWESISALP